VHLPGEEFMPALIKRERDLWALIELRPANSRDNRSMLRHLFSVTWVWEEPESQRRCLMQPAYTALQNDFDPWALGALC
jgi:hypothetical protein